MCPVSPLCCVPWLIVPVHPHPAGDNLGDGEVPVPLPVPLPLSGCPATFCLSLSCWILALSPIRSGRAPDLSLRAESRGAPCSPWGSLCLTWGAVPPLSFLPRCQRGQSVGSGCRRQWGGGVPPHPQSFTLPSHLPGQSGGVDPPPGLHDGCFPAGFAVSCQGWKGRGFPPPPSWHGAPQGCSPTEPLLPPG